MASSASSDDVSDAYESLLQKFERISNLGNAGGVLSWDQQVMMPEGGTPARSNHHERIPEFDTCAGPTARYGDRESPGDP